MCLTKFLQPVSGLAFDVQRRGGHPVVWCDLVKLEVRQTAIQPQVRGGAIEPREIVLRWLVVVVVIVACCWIGNNSRSGESALRSHWNQQKAMVTEARVRGRRAAWFGGHARQVRRRQGRWWLLLRSGGLVKHGGDRARRRCKALHRLAGRADVGLG